MPQKQPQLIRCPHCKEGSHPVGTQFCPSTGKPLRNNFLIFLIVIVLTISFIIFYQYFKSSNVTVTSSPASSLVVKHEGEQSKETGGTLPVPIPPPLSQPETDLKRFLSQLESGEWLVIVGSYKNQENAQKKIEEIKSDYYELFQIQSDSELYKKYHDKYGEGKFFDGRYWVTYIGGFYSYNSAELLKEKAVRELGINDDAYVKNPLAEEPAPTDADGKIAGWIFIGAYDKNHEKLYGNIDEFPVKGKTYQFSGEKLYNLRQTPPKSVTTYYNDLKRDDIVGRIREGNVIIMEIKEFLVNGNKIKIWAKIENKD